MSYRHLTTEERVQLELLHGLGWSSRKIGEQMNRHHSSIAREGKRNSQANYIAKEAQSTAEKRRTEQATDRAKRTSTLPDFLEEKLGKSWSPEQIDGYRKRISHPEKVSFQTIYRWIYFG